MNRKKWKAKLIRTLVIAALLLLIIGAFYLILTNYLPDLIPVLQPRQPGGDRGVYQADHRLSRRDTRRAAAVPAGAQHRVPGRAHPNCGRHRIRRAPGRCRLPAQLCRGQFRHLFPLRAGSASSTTGSTWSRLSRDFSATSRTPLLKCLSSICSPSSPTGLFRISRRGRRSQAAAMCWARCAVLCRVFFSCVLSDTQS